MRLLASFVAASLLVALGCGEEEDDDKFGAAKVEFSRATTLTLDTDEADYVSPEYFGIKLISVYLSSTRDETGHSPSESTIYINPSCLVDVGEGDGTKSVTIEKEAHIGRCDIEGGATSSNDEGDTIDLVVRDYIDLASSAEAVNTAIAAQGFQVREGTYRYVVVTLGGAGGGTGVGEQTDTDGSYDAGSVPNIKYKHADMSTARTFRQFATFNTELSADLEVTEDKSVMVTVSYDVTKLMSLTETSDSDNCVTEDDQTYCAHLPAFTTSVSEVDSF